MRELIMGASVGIIWSVTLIGTCALIQNAVSRILWGLFLCGILALTWSVIR